MTDVYNTLDDDAKAVVDAVVFLIECDRRKNLSVDALGDDTSAQWVERSTETPKGYQKYFTPEYMQRLRDAVAMRYAGDKSQASNSPIADFLQPIANLTAESYINQAKIILESGLRHPSGINIDISDLVESLDHLKKFSSSKQGAAYHPH